MRLLCISSKWCRVVVVLALLTIGGIVTIYHVSRSELLRTGQHLGSRAHLGYVARVVFSPDGKTLASASNDKTVKLWNVASGQLRHVLEGHSDYVWALAFSPTGDILASGSHDHSIMLWDVTSWQLQRVIKGHTGPVVWLGFSPDGTILASESEDQSTILWNMATAKPSKTLTRTPAIAFSPDGNLIACSGEYPSGIGTVWDAKKLATKHDLAESQRITSLAFSPDNTTVAGSMVLASDDPAGEIGIWDVSTGRRKGSFAVDCDAMGSIAFTPDGATLMTCGRQAVKTWCGVSLTPKWTIHAHPRCAFYCAVLSPDGRFLAAGGEVITFPGPGAGEVGLWDMQTGKEVAVIGGFTQPVTTLAFSRGSDLLASGSYTGDVRIWNVAEVLENANGNTADPLASSDHR